MKRILIFLLLCSVTLGADQVIRYVDTDVVGGEADGTSWEDAYSDLETAQSTEAKDISVETGSDEYYTFVCRASSGTADTSDTDITGWTQGTTGANYVEVYADDFPTDGIYDATKYRMHNNDALDACIVINDNYVRIHHMQLLLTLTSSTQRGAMYVGSQGADNLILISNVIFKGDLSDSASNYSYGLLINDEDAIVRLWNCTATGFYNGIVTALAAFYSRDGASNTFYNCVAYGNQKGFFSDVDNPTSIINCVSSSNNDDFDFLSGETIDYCASDDGDGTNSVDAVSGDWDNEFTDANNGDFTPVAGGNILTAGANDPGSGLYSTDIMGESYVTDTWARGAYADVVSSGVSGQAIIISKIIDMKAIIYGPLKFDKAA